MDINWPGERLMLKLWETLAEKGMGKLLTPWQARREAKAHAEIRRNELLMLAQAEADAAEIRAGRKRYLPDGTLVTLTEKNRVGEKVDTYCSVNLEFDLVSLGQTVTRSSLLEHARTEINASKAIIFAEQVLADDPQEPSQTKIDDDWLHTWHDYASKISTEELQRLWGKVLAGEVKSPGSCSLRTLAFLRNLSKSEAENIARLATYVIGGALFKEPADYLSSRGIPFSFILSMQELGVIAPGTNLSKTLNSSVASRFHAAMLSHGKALMIEHENPKTPLALAAYPLTSVGRELMKLGSFEPDVEFLRLLGSSIARKGYSVLLVDFKYVNAQEIEYRNETVITA